MCANLMQKLNPCDKTHYKVSRKHSIPKSTLYDRISGKVKHADKPGLKQLYQVTGFKYAPIQVCACLERLSVTLSVCIRYAFLATT